MWVTKLMLTTSPWLLSGSNEKVYYLNSVLASKPISKLYRSPDQWDAIEFQNHSTSLCEKIGILKEKMTKYIESLRQNLAATFVNGFVNAGFGVDKLMTAPTTETSEACSSGGWLFKNKEHGKASAAASLGLIMLWDVDGLVDKYLYSNDNHVVAGALLAVGIITCGVRNERHPAYALLYDSVNMEDLTIHIGAIMGLGLAYARRRY